MNALDLRTAPLANNSPSASSPFGTIKDALAELNRGRPVIIFGPGRRSDGDSRVSGDLVIAAQFASAEAIQLLADEASGRIHLALPAADCDRLALKPAGRPRANGQVKSELGSIMAKRGAANGSTAADRAATIAQAIDPATRPEDLARPGHVFPLRESPGGIAERQGRAEAALALMRLAKLTPAATLSEVRDESGELSDIAGLFDLAQRLDIWIVEIGQLARQARRGSRRARRLPHRGDGGGREVSSKSSQHDKERCRR